MNKIFLLQKNINVMIKTYLFLFVAIFCEVAGTMLLPVIQNFTKFIPTTIMAVCYLSALYFLTYVLNKIPIAIVYELGMD